MSMSNINITSVLKLFIYYFIFTALAVFILLAVSAFISEAGSGDAFATAIAWTFIGPPFLIQAVVSYSILRGSKIGLRALIIIKILFYLIMGYAGVGRNPSISFVEVVIFVDFIITIVGLYLITRHFDELKSI